MNEDSANWEHERSLVGEAVSIGRQLCARSLLTRSGKLAWTGPSGYGTNLTPLRVKQLGPHLYDGTLGISLFFAALARITNDDEFRDLSLKISFPIRQKLLDLVAEPVRADRLRLSIGGLIGLGSFIYSFLYIGELLNDPDLVDAAHKATALITAQRIKQDTRVRIQTGCAGAILALLALHKRIPEPNHEGKTPLELASECAQHLISRMAFFDNQHRAWELSPGKPPLAGFSYGAAGISYALLRLWEASRRDELWHAAQEGWSFVRGFYSPEHGGWRDPRSLFERRYRPRQGTWKDWWASGSLEDLDPEDRESKAPEHLLLDTWCHGSSGIALARLGALHLAAPPAAREEVSKVLDRVRSYMESPSLPPGSADDICCGHMGQIELLLYAHAKLGHGDLLNTAREFMIRLYHRAKEKGRYELSAARGTDIFAPSLFQGIAGIGYTLLRIASPPEALPCLVLLD